MGLGFPKLDSKLSRAYLLGGNCFCRPREALRGSNSEATDSNEAFEPRLDNCSSSSAGFCRGFDLESTVTYWRAFKQRPHIAGLVIRRKTCVNRLDTSPEVIL
jgi:hypothetical protein